MRYHIFKDAKYVRSNHLNYQNLITFLDNLEDAVMFAKLNAVHNIAISTTELTKILEKVNKLYGKN